MRKLLVGVMMCVGLTCVGLMTGGTALALPTTPFFATAEMVATVRSVSAGGQLLDAEGNYVRDMSLADLSLLPWNVGDTLTVRWETHSSDLVGCGPGHTVFIFGGITKPVEGSLGGGCHASGTASFAEVSRAGGGTSFVVDSWETTIGRGPLFDMAAGAIFPADYEPIDGLVTDCCAYVYDPENDAVISVESNGSGNEVISWPVHFLMATFGETEGGGYMPLLTSQMFGNPDWGYEIDGRPAGMLEFGYIGVSFDVEWRSTFQLEQTQVPEPAGLALMGAGLLGVAGARRRRGSLSSVSG